MTAYNSSIKIKFGIPSFEQSLSASTYHLESVNTDDYKDLLDIKNIYVINYITFYCFASIAVDYFNHKSALSQWSSCSFITHSCKNTWQLSPLFRLRYLIVWIIYFNSISMFSILIKFVKCISCKWKKSKLTQCITLIVSAKYQFFYLLCSFQW